MTTPRRNILRFPQPAQETAQANRTRQKIEAKVEQANAVIERRWKRLNRAVTVIHKHRKQIARLQRQLQQLP